MVATIEATRTKITPIFINARISLPSNLPRKAKSAISVTGTPVCARELDGSELLGTDCVHFAVLLIEFDLRSEKTPFHLLTMPQPRNGDRLGLIINDQQTP